MYADNRLVLPGQPVSPVILKMEALCIFFQLLKCVVWLVGQQLALKICVCLFQNNQICPVVQCLDNSSSHNS